MIIVSAPVQRIEFWGFSVLVRTFGSGLGDCWDVGLGLGLDNTYSYLYKKQLRYPKFSILANDITEKVLETF